ncbi:hypothetical protein NG895_28715 [Aeoliella sp. ICT_H6.2]|uniref:Uncharacterized protein n=1 Tax=Aeoliella straminimaris TaxID=2954799 RepID=A0A9X2JJI0_9BACT|nr:hypothetical protein [Aeoliella straminimaris]MCO6047906.1 hypothetical protein [Aeoliella straminimaris]
MKFAIACATLAAIGLVASDASAQCSTCAVQQVTWSPVVVNTQPAYDGWYLGKYVGRLGRRIFGPAPAPAYAVGYAPSVSFASSAPTYATSYAPSCSTCGTSPCGCAQTTFRPVIMQPASGCSTCGGCGTCSTCNSGVVQSSYDAPVASSCPTCNTSAYMESSPSSNMAPSLNDRSAPPRTFQETDRLDPTPAAEESTESQVLDLSPPLLLDPNDKLTKRPTSPVWTAVYKQPAKITNVSSASSKPSKTTMGWSAGH